jgi:ADP-dependent NAD(P)H-hydrate dehydratase
VRPLEELLADYPLEPAQGAKDERGTVVVVGGPAECPGAVILAAEAALRCGAGRLQLVVDPAVAPLVAATVPESFAVGWDPTSEPTDEVIDLVAHADATVIGPGHRADLTDAAVALAPHAGDRPLVLDAGALSAAPRLRAQQAIVLAPNPSEAADLAGATGSEVELAVKLGATFRAPVAVRGEASVIADGDGAAWCHRTGATGLGTPGSGDVLMGILVALLARGMAPAGALAWAVALHSRAGEALERSKPVGYLAREVVGHLPTALAELVVGDR